MLLSVVAGIVGRLVAIITFVSVVLLIVHGEKFIKQKNPTKFLLHLYYLVPLFFLLFFFSLFQFVRKRKPRWCREDSSWTQLKAPIVVVIDWIWLQVGICYRRCCVVLFCYLYIVEK